MKRVHIEPWTTKEKLCLASAVLHSGDQNWMSVSRILRMYGEPNRPLDWYSQKQCAVQYECLLTNAGSTKRKKRSEKGVETVDIPGEAIVRKLTQERIEELKMMIAEDKADYLRIKKLQEDVDSGKLDDRLDEVELQMEEEFRRDKEKHSFNQFENRKTEADISSRLGMLTSRNKTFGDTGQDGDSNDSSMEVELKPSPTPTSPLLTSLLQSPSPALLHRNSSNTPTISSLLHSAPSIPRVQDSPTLSKLLESPSTQTSTINIKASIMQPSLKETAVISNVVDSKSEESRVTLLDQDESAITDFISEVKIKQTEDEDILDSTSLENKEKKSNVVRRLELELQESPRELEKEEQSSLNHTQDSDTLEEQLETEIELDSQAVDMIVMGPNQSAVIAVHHDTSNEHLEEEGVVIKEELSIDDSIKEEQCEEVTEETIVLMNEEELSKPVEDALKMINDATIVVAEQAQVVEIETPVVDEDHEVVTNVEEVTSSEVKEIVAEEQVVLEEVVTEEIKDDITEDIQTEKSSTVEINTEEEITLEDTKHDIIEEEVIAEESTEVQLSVEDVVVEMQQESGTTEIIAGMLSDMDIKIENVDENEMKADKQITVNKEIEEKKDEHVELDLHIITSENKPKKVGRRRKSSKEAKEKDTTKAKEPPSVTSLIKEPTAITSTEKESTPSISPVKSPLESILGTKEPVTYSPTKEPVLSTSPANLSLLAKEPIMVCTSLAKESTSSLEVELVPVVESTSSEKEPELSTSLNKLLATTSTAKEPVVSTSSVKETLSLLRPENIISDFKVPRSDTPSTTDEDNEPIAYIAKRGKPKRNSGVDSKPNSPCPQSFDEGSKEFRAWKKSIMLVYNRLSTHKYASIFLRPITNERARGYHTVIHRPMDLSTLKKNIETGHIRTTVEFQRDVMLMFQNAIMYNNTNTEIFEMASVMQRECIQHFQLMVEAMGEGVPWRESAMNNEKTSRTRIKTEDLPLKRKRAHNSTSEDSKLTPPVKRKKVGNI